MGIVAASVSERGIFDWILDFRSERENESKSENVHSRTLAATNHIYTAGRWNRSSSCTAM